MGDDVRLGRIAGVAVGASWSLLVILALITWILGSEVLPVAVADAHPVVYWAVAAVTAIAFLASLLAHELAHSVVARGRGIEVEGITLWMFGGMSRLKGEAPDARTEERMALAGPLASLALGAAMTVLAVLLAGAHAPDVVAAAIAWLGLMNGMLAVFNLLPAYPLDGGRVLRAIIWRHQGPARCHRGGHDHRDRVRLRPHGPRGRGRGRGRRLGWHLAGAARLDRAQCRPG
jgi:Zn-dependent protease